MLFKLSVLAAAAVLVGLVASSPILENDNGPAMVERAAVPDGAVDIDNVLMKRAPGPSGQVLQPVGDQWVYSEVGWPGSGFRFVYKPANVKNPNPNCVNQRQACWARTSWVQVTLVGNADPTKVYKLADYLHTSLDNPSANIDTWLGIPQEAACGVYRVRVVETQRYFNQWVTFQSAAPLINMQCVRYAGPSKA